MIKLIKSSFYNETETKQELADFIIKRNIFSMNEECAKFESSFSVKQQRKYSVYVANGSVANLLLIQTMLNVGRFKRGDKIGFSALTWPTNVMPLIQLGLEPIALDCNLNTLNVSPDELKKYIPKLKGLFLTNVLGFCDDLPRIKQLCSENNIVLLEDNCESLGSQISETLLGNFGLASTFSFFVGHHLSTIEGGMVCTDDKEIYEQLLIARAHGWDRNLNSEAQHRLRKINGIDDFHSKYTFYDLASNFRPTEINGFIGNKQIRYWDQIVSRRAENFKRFNEVVNKNDDFIQFKLNNMKVISNFAMPIICKSAELTDFYRKKFEEAYVEIRPVIAGNITKQPFYHKYVKDIRPCPNSDVVHTNGFYFGNNPEMTDNEIDTLCKLLTK